MGQNRLALALLFNRKKILLGVSGGIASYKSCEVIRELRQAGAEVRVMMTPHACEFVSPLTFSALSEHPVLVDMFPSAGSAQIEHIDWSRWGHVIVICPATANTIARLAHGFADEPISATVRATRVPVVLCPAMNTGMWEDPTVQENVAHLSSCGYRFVGPEFGALATTTEGEGVGRLARIEWILDEVLSALHPDAPLKGKNVLVTAGRTEEYLDPARMLTNPSSGRMGFAIAKVARALGANVTLVHGPTELPMPYKVNGIPIVSAKDMKNAVLDHYSDTDILVMAAAVCDYRPRSKASEKIKKTNEDLPLALERTDDILELVGARKTNAVHVGFAVETENEIDNALDKLRRKNLDLIVLNNPKHSGAGFKKETNRVSLIDATGEVEELPLLSKAEVAFQILQKIIALK